MGTTNKISKETLACTDARLGSEGDQTECPHKAVDVCKLTKKYRRAVDSTMEDAVDNVFEVEELRKALDYYTDAWGCSMRKVWVPCREMEARMGRMDIGHANC